MSKIKVISSKYDGTLYYVITDYNAMKSENKSTRRYARKRYWVETHKERGMRICWQSYDSYNNEWCVKPNHEKYYPFVAIVVRFGEVKKLYLNNLQHPSYVDDMLEKYIFDDVQSARLKEVKDMLEKRWTI